MCGRYTVPFSGDELARLLNARPPEEPWRPRFNLAPTQKGLVLRAGPEGRTLDALRWGLVPRWAKDKTIGNRMINARAESVAEKPAYRNLLRNRRCLVPADGFYEWQAPDDAGPKQPWLIRRRDGAPLLLAGLWDRWRGEDPPVESYTIVTGPPNRLLERIHRRMPVILGPQDAARWLGEEETDPGALTEMLGPCPAGELEAVPVGREVNSPANDTPECVRPAGEPLRVE